MNELPRTFFLPETDPRLQSIKFHVPRTGHTDKYMYMQTDRLTLDSKYNLC